MAYGGFYKKEATQCLKAALMANYTAGLFNAGRGSPVLYNMYRYDIQIRTHEKGFGRFFAHESVGHSFYTTSGGGIPKWVNDGEHDIWGMALI